MKKIAILFLLISVSWCAVSQTTIDSTALKKDAKTLKFNYKQLIIPTALITFGAIGMNNDKLKFINHEVNEEIVEGEFKRYHFDDALSLSPYAAYYALDWVGVESKNNFKDKTIILATASILMFGTTHILKTTTHQIRPDQTDYQSFPSGHTATAFMGAELVYQEYKDQSVWYGVSAYAVAGLTGYMRIYNNKHWITDVAAGAGIGILSAKAGYWLYPTISKLFTKKESKTKTVMLPFYNGKTVGLGLVSRF